MLMTSLASEMMSSPPQISAIVPLAFSNAGASRVPSVARARQAVLDHQQVDVLLPQPLPQRDVLVVLQANHIDQQRILDALQPIAKVLGDQVFDEFAHVLLLCQLWVCQPRQLSS